MKKILLVFAFIFTSLTYSQNPFSLTKSVSFGLNHHTNRDDAFISTIDNEKNSILIGTTERDSTFTDVLITKLDENYNLVWQKRHSVPTNLSYDIPLKVFTNSNNDVYVFGRSSTNSSKENGILFYVKYDKYGNKIFNKTIGKTDGSDYHDFGYFDVALNNDDSFNLIYAPYNSKEFIFKKINSNGSTNELFKKELINEGIKGKIVGDKFYFILKKYKNPNNINNGYYYYYLNINKEGNENKKLIDNSDFYDYNLSNNLSKNFKLDINNNNLYLITQNQLNNDTKGKINVSLVGKDNLFKYSFISSSSNNYYLLGSFINSLEKIVIIANDKNTNKLVFLSLNSSNQLVTLKEINTYLGTGFKLNKDGTFFITTSNSNMRLFSNDLIEINSFNNSDTYNLIDFSKIDNNTITSFGVEIKKMHPESKFTSQLNIVSEKINSTNILNKYTFSGEGTSANFQQIISVDNNNDYIVLSTEYLSPTCFFIGCGTAPLSGKIIKYTSDLKKIWELDLTGQVNNITSNYESENFKIDSKNNIFLNLQNKKRDKSYLYKISSNGNLLFKKESVKSKEIVIDETNNKVFIITDLFRYTNQSTKKTLIWSEMISFDSNNGDLIKKYNYNYKKYFNHLVFNGSIYAYFLNLSTADNFSSEHFVSLYKDGEFVFERKINLKENSEINPYQPIIKSNGTIIFSTYSSSDSTEKKLHKISLENNYSFSQINERLFKILKIKNKIIGYDNEQYLNIYDDNLNLIKKSNVKFSNCCSGFNYSIINNTIFIQWSNPGGNNSAFLNEKLEVLNQFNFNNLFEKNFTFDKKDNLITTNRYGNGIYLKPWFSWTRGLLSKYNFNSTLSIENINKKKEIITLFPNPTKNLFTIILKNNTLKKVNLYSINGQLLHTFFKYKIDLSTYSKGLYLLKIYTLENTIINSKVLKN